MKKLNKMRFISLLLPLLLVVMMAVPIMPTISMAAQPTVDLGTTSSFAVLAGSTITNTGTTIINGDAGGDIGLYPGTAFTVTGVVYSGTAHLADAVAIMAKDDLVTAYDDAAGRTPVTRIPTELGGTTLTPGTYDSADGTFEITGTLTLDAQGDPNGVFVFKTASTLITASGSNVNLINSARYCRTFWKVGSSATLGSNSHFTGHIFALASITANTGATVQGQLLARNGAVTLDNNTITNGICDTIAAPPATTATLHVIKHVIGGTAVAANFNLHVKTAAGIDVAASPAAGVETGRTYTLAAGTYVVSEDASALTNGYTASYSSSDPGSSGGSITLASGETKTVTITNTYNTPAPATPATLLVIKHVIGGTAVAANFNLHVKTAAGIDVAASPAAGVETGRTYTLAAGTYVVSEDASALTNRYNTSYSSSDPGSSGGSITLASGETKTVTITNTYTTSSGGGGGASIPPLINVIKTPEPLALTSGQGLVTYTYKVTNPGMVALSNVSVTDDKVSPLTYVSGDVNADNLLQLDETWIYTGKVNLNATTTNTATAKGSANGITATDIAFATVVVTDTPTATVYPPLINVIKTPEPLALTSGQGLVTYTYKVTNPGMVALSNVSVIDDKVSPLTYVSGDVNTDNLLQPDETWIYTGTANLNATTTNTATAKGSANGMTATDIAFATVVVTPSVVVTPTVTGGNVTTTVTGGQLPKTATPWYNVLLAGVALTLIGAVVWRSRKRYE